MEANCDSEISRKQILDNSHPTTISSNSRLLIGSLAETDLREALDSSSKVNYIFRSSFFLYPFVLGDVGDFPKCLGFLLSCQSNKIKHARTRYKRKGPGT
jgi:hypothetical protein